jgi:magnesium transporter
MKLVQKRSKKTGLSPGTLVHIGENRTETVKITLFNYAGAQCDERTVTNPNDLQPRADETVTWINVGGVHKVDVLEAFILCSWRISPIRTSGPSSTITRPMYFWWSRCSR